MNSDLQKKKKELHKNYWYPFYNRKNKNYIKITPILPTIEK